MANVTWKIARRNNTQLPLAIVLALAVVVVLLGKAENGLFDRARMRITDWMQPLLSVANTPVVAVNRWLGSASDVVRVYQENLALKQENARLKQWRNLAVVTAAQVKRYQALLHVVPSPDIHSVLAHVIGRANRPFLETMILDAGSAHQVKPGEAVVDSSGMIGRIYLAGTRTSWVIMLTDLNSHIPVSIASANAKGASVQAIMSGDNSAMPTLDSLPQNANLRDGDQVVSSGDGGLLPPGLPVGSVVQTPNGYRVALLADPASSEDVEVMAFDKAPEEMPAATAKQIPAVAAGLAPATAPGTTPAMTSATASATAPATVAPAIPAARIVQPVMPLGSLAHPVVPPPLPQTPPAAPRTQTSPAPPAGGNE